MPQDKNSKCQSIYSLQCYQQEAKTEEAPNSLCSISPGGTAHWWRVGWNHTDIGIMSLLREPRTKDVNSFTDAFLKEGRWEGL